MPEQRVREIQLGGKQLVFLFVASAGLAVVIFLLGVSVGRGVDERSSPAMTGGVPVAPIVPVAPEDMPPPTEITPEQQAILGTLAESAPDRPEPRAPEDAAPPLDEPDAADAPIDEVSNASLDEPADVPDNEPANPPPAEPPPAPPPSPAGEWVVQIGAYRSRETADREAAGLVDRGFSAHVDSSAQTGLFRVRIGPFEARAEADAVAARLRQQGVQPFVTR